MHPLPNRFAETDEDTFAASSPHQSKIVVQTPPGRSRQREDRPCRRSTQALQRQPLHTAAQTLQAALALYLFSQSNSGSMQDRAVSRQRRERPASASTTSPARRTRPPKRSAQGLRLP